MSDVDSGSLYGLLIILGVICVLASIVALCVFDNSKDREKNSWVALVFFAVGFIAIAGPMYFSEEHRGILLLVLGLLALIGLGELLGRFWPF